MMFASRNGATQNESNVGAALDASGATAGVASLSNSRSIGQLRYHARLFWRLRLEQAPRRFIPDSLFPSTDYPLASLSRQAAAEKSRFRTINERRRPCRVPQRIEKNLYPHWDLQARRAVLQWRRPTWCDLRRSSGRGGRYRFDGAGASYSAHRAGPVIESLGRREQALRGV